LRGTVRSEPWIINFEISIQSNYRISRKIGPRLLSEAFADVLFIEPSLPSATVGKDFSECFSGFAEWFKHSTKHLIPVVIEVKYGLLDYSFYQNQRRREMT
jgi:hypothetical protein